jgi:CRP-like cAMP-binding protein
MKWIKHIHLSETLIDKLKKTSSTIKTFSLKSHLYYEGQTPIVAYLILKGSIQLSRNKKICNTLRPGTLLGIEEVIEKKSSDVSAEVLGNSTLCFLDRSTLLEIKKGDNIVLGSILTLNEDEEVII